MIVKVCGITQDQNLHELSKLAIDIIGINFYSPSKRFIKNQKLSVYPNQKRAGVFVQETEDGIKESIEDYELDYAQLHGDEGADFCQLIQRIIPIIKVFRITENFDWNSLHDFQFADYFLFDTMTEKYGGSGKKFNWDQLDGYELKIPFLLSGGIGIKDVHNLKSINHAQFMGVDINSQFETQPGIKDALLVKKFIEEIRK